MSISFPQTGNKQTDAGHYNRIWGIDKAQNVHFRVQSYISTYEGRQDIYSRCWINEIVNGQGDLSASCIFPPAFLALFRPQFASILLLLLLL